MKLYCTVNEDSSVELTTGPCCDHLPAGSFEIDRSKIPDSREHREAWVWDGEKVVVDPARIRQRQPRQQAPSAPVQAADIGPLRQELAERMQAVFTAMQQEFDARLERIREETDRRILCTLEAISVVSRTQADEPIDLKAVPALASELRARGLPVDEKHIIAVADEHAARIYQITAGRA